MRTILTFLLTIGLQLAFAAPMNFVDVYPGPTGIHASKNYTVTIHQAGKKFPSFVYYSTPLDNDADNAEKIRHEVVMGINQNPVLSNFYFGGVQQELDIEQSCSYTCFSFYGPIDITIDYPEPIVSFKILPGTEQISGTISQNQLNFHLDNPQKLGIVINNNYLNPLFLFADAPETDVPDKAAEGTLIIHPGDNMQMVKEKAQKAHTLYFEPGIHHIGVAFEVISNQTVYLEGGAYLLGTLHGHMASNVRIRGRGILAGDSISRAAVKALKREVGFQKRIVERMRYHAINMLSDQNDSSWNAFADYPGHGCDNLNIEGIIIANPRQFHLRAAGVPITIHNVKMVGSWPYNTDGISTIGQANTTVFDCFFHCNDDAIYITPNNCHIHHCRFWQGNNGCVFQFAWGSAPYPQGGGYIHDCQVLHNGHVAEANNRMVIGSRKSGPGDIEHVLIKNIHIEGPVWSLFRLETNGGGNLGSLTDITLENISVDGPVIHPSQIISSKNRAVNDTSSSWISNIHLKNITLDHRKLSPENVIIGNYQVKNIVFD